MLEASALRSGMTRMVCYRCSCMHTKIDIPYNKKKKKLRGLSPRTNYTNLATLSATLVPILRRGCHVVSVTDPCGRILGFLDRSRYFFFQVSPQLYSRGEWTPFQAHYFSENLVAPEIEPWSSGSVARNSDHWTTEAAYFLLHNINKFNSYLTVNTIHFQEL
jgi:hypothetical protein